MSFFSILEWIVKNIDSIIAGVIASAVVLLLQSFIKTLSLVVANWMNKTLILSHVWGFVSADRLYVISGSIKDVSPEVCAAILTGPDADAANESIATLRFLHPKAPLFRFYSPNFPPELLKENIISVGGPVNNLVTKKIMSFMTDKVAFDKNFVLHDKISGHNYQSTYAEKDMVLRDYGLLLKLPNPFGTSTEVLILAGCETYGVLATTRTISLHPDGQLIQQQILKKLGPLAYFRDNYYIAIIQCDVIGNEVGNLKLVDLHRLNRNIFK